MQASLSNSAGKNESLNLEKEQEISNMIAELLQDYLPGKHNLNDVEEKTTELFERIRNQSCGNVIESQDPSAVCCPKCGKSMKNVNRLNRVIQGLAPYEFKRRNFHCDDCNYYFRPLDEIIDCEGNFSRKIESAKSLLGQRIPFEESKYFLKELLGVDVSHESIQETTETIGNRVADDEQKRVSEVLDENGFVKEALMDKPAKKKRGAGYMELDACKVHTREEGWKNVRNGILFADKDRVRTDKHHQHILRKKYFSVFNHGDGALDNFNNRTTQAAYDFGFHLYEYPVIIGDGEVCIWNYADVYHPDAIQILDYFHADEYLGNAFKSLTFSDEKERKANEKCCFDWLYEGEITNITSWLLQQNQTEAVIDCIRYYENNIDRMDYGKYRKMGLDVGSGAIESSHKILVQSRMKQSGMHWNMDNVQSILSLRARYLSGEWEDVKEIYLLAA